MFRLSYPRVLGYCLRRAPEPIAHDATAEVFAVAWRRRRDLPDDDGAVPWLLAIARRVLANEMRGQRRRDRLATSISVTRVDASADASDDPVTRALDCLATDDRELLRLVYWDDLSHAEIALVLDISVNAVAVRVHRARTREGWTRRGDQMPADDVIDQMLRDADPLRDVVIPDADSMPARRVLAAAKRHRARNVRRVALVAVAAVVAIGAGVAARGDGHPRTSSQVVCVFSPLADGVMNFDVRTDDPVRVCAAHWHEFGTPRHPAPVPDRLTACVEGSAEGSIKVYAGGPDVCEAHGAVGYVGPTDEQRRFADFLEEGKALQENAGGPCMSPDRLHDAVRQLLAKHRLVGWTFGRPNGPEPKCMAVVGFSEPKRLVITN